MWEVASYIDIPQLYSFILFLPILYPFLCFPHFSFIPFTCLLFVHPIFILPPVPQQRHVTFSLNTKRTGYQYADILTVLLLTKSNKFLTQGILSFILAPRFWLWGFIGNLCRPDWCIIQIFHNTISIYFVTHHYLW